MGQHQFQLPYYQSTHLSLDLSGAMLARRLPISPLMHCKLGTSTINQRYQSKTYQHFSTRIDSSILSKITAKEKESTHQDGPVAGGPTARAQQHFGEPITSKVLSDITAGEKTVTGGERLKRGATATVQSELSKSTSSEGIEKGIPVTNTTPRIRVIPTASPPVMDADTVTKVHSAEQKFTGKFVRGDLDGPPPVEAGPTEAAKSHLGERISGRVVRDVMEGEKKITGVERPVKGGPAGIVSGVMGRR
ncbi:hypothetical protein TWF730_006015 [Orbilia blumenaviensis]|uniref:Uncharacterized protein n=1 Tax=Orbilia blumenaviensis TaxID=1796055 RepID=A0AAV9VK31_9PEZI